MAQKRIVVTGATGFLGTSVLGLLAALPDTEVFGISKRGGRARQVPVDAVDLSRREEVMAWWRNRGGMQVHAVVHLAAEIPASFDGPEAERSFATNIALTQNALALAADYGGAFVYASSTSVYGTHLFPPVSEDSTVHPSNGYSRAKAVGEDLVTSYSRQSGKAGAILRLSAPYGPHQRLRTVVRVFLDAAVRGEDILVHGSGNRTQDFTYVEDAARAFLRAVDHEANGIYNISGGHPVTMSELARLALATAPSNGSRIVWGEHPDPQESYRGVFLIEKARRDLDFEPEVSLEEGLRRCLAADSDSSAK